MIQSIPPNPSDWDGIIKCLVDLKNRVDARQIAEAFCHCAHYGGVDIKITVADSGDFKDVEGINSVQV